MILGIDVGGTHTDAVLLDKTFIKKKVKVLTCQEDMMSSLTQATKVLLRDENMDFLKRIVLSTTLSTNAIVQGQISPVGLILASGPGLSSSELKLNQHTYFTSGYMNHRGIEAASINSSEIENIKTKLKEKSIEHLGIIGKFSPRNPKIETAIGNMVANNFRHISLGHRMSGHLNFPRRIATTYLNASIWEIYGLFAQNCKSFAEKLGIKLPLYILKADGGTFEIDQSSKCPVQTIHSGSAASIMGIMSLADHIEDAIALDIGGTTTDIALFADGAPLLEPLGVTIGNHKTLVRGLMTKSIGIGGDSKVKYENGEVIIGPVREGPAAAFGGQSPTPTDAMIVLGLINIGDFRKASAAISTIADAMCCDIQKAAQKIFNTACQKIISTINEMITEVNNKPVYTIHEILEEKRLEPKILYVVGGPAEPMAPRLSNLLNIPYCIPEHAEVANAIGAALARTTTELTLLADTEKQTMTIVEEGIQTRISRSFTRKEALSVCLEKLRKRALSMGATDQELETEITEDQIFNMVRGFYTSGQNIRITAQIKPGLIGTAIGRK